MKVVKQYQITEKEIKKIEKELYSIKHSPFPDIQTERIEEILKEIKGRCLNV